MLGKNVAKLTSYSLLSAMILASVAFLAAGKDAAALTANEISESMSTDEQVAYISGVVEGLAFARWMADDRDTAGSQCIWDWFLHSNQTMRINAQMDWFEQHPDQQVSTLMYALIREECGD